MKLVTCEEPNSAYRAAPALPSASGVSRISSVGGAPDATERDKATQKHPKSSPRNGGRAELNGRPANLQKRAILTLDGLSPRTRGGLLSRFEAKISRDPITECWEWTAARNCDGYGVIGVGSPRRGYAWVRAAHRVSWLLFRGPLQPGLVLDHLCRNRACVNPDHLEPVTHGENVRRGYLSAAPRHTSDETKAKISVALRARARVAHNGFNMAARSLRLPATRQVEVPQ